MKFGYASGGAVLLAALTTSFFSSLLPGRLYAAQEAQQAARAPMDQVLGTVTAVNAGEKRFTVKEDKTGTEYVVSGASARRYVKVPPGAKDLKSAQEIDPSQIAIGDRLLARGRKQPDGPKLDAALVVVMTAGELQQKHEAELADWQKRGNRGTVASLNPAAKEITMAVRMSGGAQTVKVTTTPETQFVRYAPNSVKYADAKPSSFEALRPGDQLRVLGDRSEDGQQIKAERIVSGAFKTVGGTIASISDDQKQLTIKNMQTNQPVVVTLTTDSAVRRLPPQMAMMLARRLAGGTPGTVVGGHPAPTPDSDTPGRTQGAMATRRGADNSDRMGGGGRASGDISQMVERLPQIPATELKPGNAVIVSGGAADGDSSQLIAINVVAGVEPLFASAPASNGRQSDALGMWNLDIGAPSEQ